MTEIRSSLIPPPPLLLSAFAELAALGLTIGSVIRGEVEWATFFLVLAVLLRVQAKRG